jgi:WD40 repeat protein
LFTACRDDRERAAFAATLADRAAGPLRQALVLVAVRADFYGHCAAYPELSRLMGANHVLVGPMRRDELRRAIELPAERAGLVVEPELVDALVADVADEPGALPLLSSSLLELWQRRDGRRLRLDAYDRAGGVRGAVSRLAERAYAQIDDERRAVARRILLRLADGEGDAVVRRRVPLAELEGEGLEETLAVLADQRLVTIDEGEVEVAHEALLREWPRLRAWLEEDTQGRRLHAHIIAAARGWERAGRDPGELYRGARLAAALDWAGAHERELNASERAFVDASRARAEREAEVQRRANRRLRALLASLAVLLALAVVAGAVAISQRGAARDSALAADAQRLGAQSLTDDRLDHALLLARAGVALDETPGTLGSLLSVLQRSPAEVAEFRGQGWPLYPVAASPDQRRLALGDEQGFVTVYDLPSRKIASRYQWRNEGLVQGLRFSPDSRTLAVAGYETNHESRPVVDLIDPATGRRRLRITPPAVAGHPDLVILEVRFAPNGRDLLVLQFPASPNGPSILRRFDGTTGAEQRPPLRFGEHHPAALSATPDRRSVFATSAGDDRTYEIDADTLRVTGQWPVGGGTGAVSPDARTYALGLEDGAVRLVDLRSGHVRALPRSHHAGLQNLVFTPDGATLATGDEDGAVMTWDVATGRVRERLSGHTDAIQGMEVSADGHTLYAASSDTRVIAWDLAGTRRLDRPFDPGPPFVIENTSPRGLAISPDGRRLAVTQQDGIVDLLDTRTLAPRGRVRALDGYAAAVEFSPDGRLLAVTGRGGRVTLWDARTLRAAGKLQELPRGHAQALAFSPDGRLLAGATVDTPKTSVTQIWELRGRAATPVRFRALASDLAFSPDGRLLAAPGMTGPTQVRDARSGRLIAALRTADEGRSVAFSPDGTLLATGLYNGAIQLWSTKDWKPAEPALEGHAGRVTRVDFAPDGHTLLSAGADGTLQLWDVASRKPIGSPQTVEPNSYVAAVFAPDGNTVFAVSAGRSGVRWEVSPQIWKQHACAVAGRELSAVEWSDALPGRPYRAVCHGG